MNTYTTGKFASISNVTQRTIRYYDKIGLLKPSFMSEKGYRLYTDNDLLTLQRILCLKKLGFSLEEIAPMIINEDIDSFKESIELQISLINKRIQSYKHLKDDLIHIYKTLNQDEINWNKIVKLIQLSSEDDQIIKQYKNAYNLNVRINLHEKYSQNQIHWFQWIMNQIDFSQSNKILEIGCGNGELWEYNRLSLRNRDIFISDISSGMVDDARKKIGDQFNFLIIDCQKIPFKKEYFDIVIGNHMLFYVEDIDKGLSEIKRVLNVHGTFYCSTYGENHMKEIRELVEEFDSSITLSNNLLYKKFGLENGRDILNNYFSSIDLRKYDDYLIVDEVEPLLNYILSCHGNQNEKLNYRIKEFRKFLIAKIKEKGYIKISKDVGLFICKN